jgi:transcriptional regulator with PAS, ATPase and Fis domain
MDTSELQRLKQRYNIVGNCDALNRALDVAKQVASTDLSVLIVGESGVGKEIIPRLIHDNSPRKHEKYFAINCGSHLHLSYFKSIFTIFDLFFI